MNNWPKTVHDIWGAWEGVGDDDNPQPADLELIPAYLARELWLAAKVFQNRDKSPGVVSLRDLDRLHDAISRYEQELGLT
jgi:hypothetical protein